jgi:hypothetical protein
MEPTRSGAQRFHVGHDVAAREYKSHIKAVPQRPGAVAAGRRGEYPPDQEARPVQPGGADRAAAVKRRTNAGITWMRGNIRYAPVKIARFSFSLYVSLSIGTV